MAVADERELLRKLLRKPVATKALEKLEDAGCNLKDLVSHLWLLTLPGKHRKGWYGIPQFSPDVLRRYPSRFRQQAEEIEKLSRAICSAPIYREVISLMSVSLKAEGLPPDWFGKCFGELPSRLRDYAAAVKWIEEAVEIVARKAGPLGRGTLAGLQLIYYIHLTTHRPHYAEVADLLQAAGVCNYNSESDDIADALERRYRRSKYPQKIKQMKADRTAAFRAYLLRSRAT